MSELEAIAIGVLVAAVSLLLLGDPYKSNVKTRKR